MDDTKNQKEMMVDYSSNYDIEVNAKTGKEERKISRPVTSDQYNEITQKAGKSMGYTYMVLEQILLPTMRY